MSMSQIETRKPASAVGQCTCVGIGTVCRRDPEHATTKKHRATASPAQNNRIVAKENSHTRRCANAGLRTALLQDQAHARLRRRRSLLQAVCVPGHVTRKVT